MTYQVLARKWRPRRFSEVVGQEHVLRALTNAIVHNRMHHAYLFTGTRGVGKTTIARILAKALNCESRSGFDPCGECAVCRDVDAGRFIDLIEVDAASRTKVEDTRDLLENVQYAPSRGGFKVYLIDEVHMLSGHSFNALLKTLEEPPPHVKFLLATTDPQKIPVTVLSRCLQLNLKRLPPEQIRTQMARILAAESIEYEDKALNALALSADGSMRDALSLLDQAIAQGAGRVESQSVETMLGIAAEQPVIEILLRLAKGDAAGLLDCVNQLADLTRDFSEVLRLLLGHLHRLALFQVIPDRLAADEFNESLRGLAKKIPPADVQLYYQIGLVGSRDLDLAPDARSGFEMVLLRMLAFKPAVFQTGHASADHEAEQLVAPDAERDPGPDHCSLGEGPVPPNPPRADPASQQWRQIIQAMTVNGLAKELACNSVLDSADDSRIALLLDPKHQGLRSELIEQRLENALQNYYKRPLKLSIRIGAPGMATPALEMAAERQARQIAAETSIANDANIRALRENFDATILPGTTEPRGIS
ncbi:MAG: DNA polymerase III subunit gamma/tau [Methylococcaceae bacterium]|nr:DNA polymerase III subunit gamma/tau [Methylococcaceae bacterium]MCI0733952.1 DNA polymerase III subunit gamma/tau [Methylococcaceae bacterium]